MAKRRRPEQAPLPMPRPLDPDPTPLMWPCARCGTYVVVVDPLPTPVCVPTCERPAVTTDL